MTYFLYFGLYLLVLNLVTSYRLIKAEEYEKFQKIFQLIIVWCLPFFGVMIVTYFLNQIPIVLNDKLSKYTLIIKIILYPLLIKVEGFESSSKINNNGYGDTHTDIAGGTD